MISALPRRLNSSLLPAAEIRAVSCSLDESTTAVPKATMVLPPGVTMHMHEMAEIYVGQESHGYFRVVSAGAAIRNQTTVQLMGAADTLTDDIWAAEVSETSYDPDDLLRAALSHQSIAYWQAGNCDAAKAVKTAISYDDLWSVLEKIRAANPDCMWTYDYSTSPWTLSLVAMPDTVEAELRIGRNIESASVNTTDKEMCNKLYMTVTTDSSSTLIVAENAESIAKYGTVIKKATVAAADAPNPQAYAEKILAERAEPLAYISISGLDLKAITGDDFDRIKLGSLCRAVIPEYGEGVLSERVVARKWPEIIHEPLRVTVSLANAVQTFQESLQFIRRTASSARSSASKTEKELTHWETIVTAQQTTLDDLGITGLWQSGLVLDAYQGVKIWSSEQGENSYLGQITINKNTIDQTVEAVGLVWDETANEGAGGWVPSSSPAAGSVAARLSLIPGQITAAASAVENNIKSEGYIKLQAAKDAAAAEIGAQLDNGTSSISAKVKALVEGDTSLIQLVADKVTIDASDVTISGSIKLNNVITIENGVAKGSFGSLFITGGANLGSSNVYYNNVSLSSFIKSISLTGPTNNDYTLTWENAGGASTSKTFSRAASGVTVSWSGTTGTVTVLPQNQDFTITYDGPSGQSVDDITVTNNPISATLTGSGTRYARGTANLTAWHNAEDGESGTTQVNLLNDTAQVTLDIESILTAAESTARTQAVTDATLSVDAPFVLNGVIKIYPRVTFDADTEKSANPMDAQLPALATNSSGTPTAAPSTLVAGSTVYPYVQIGSMNFFGSGYTVPSSAAVNVESSHPHTMSANTETVTPSNGYDAMAQVVVDATPRYYAGKAAVTLNAHTWESISGGGTLPSSRYVQVTTSGRTDATGTTAPLDEKVYLYLSVFCANGTATARLKDNDTVTVMEATATYSSDEGGGQEEGFTYADGWRDALADVELVRSPDTGTPTYGQTVSVTAKAKANPTAGSKTAISGASTTIAAPDAPSGTVTVTNIAKHGNQTFSSSYKTVYFPVRATYSDGTYSSDYTVSCDITSAYNKGKTDGITAGDIITTNARQTSDPGSQDANFTLTYPYYILTVTVGNAVKKIRLSIPSNQ